MGKPRAASKGRAKASRRADAVPEDVKVKYELGGIALATLGGVTLAALGSGLSGSAGNGIKLALVRTFGVGAWVAPVLVIATGLYLCFALRPVMLTPKAASLVGLYVIVLAAIHSPVPQGQEFSADMVASHGGYVGACVAVALQSLFGAIGAAIVFTGLGLACVVSLLRRPVAHIAHDAYQCAGQAASLVRNRMEVVAQERRRRAVARAKDRSRSKPIVARAAATVQQPKPERPSGSAKFRKIVAEARVSTAAALAEPEPDDVEEPPAGFAAEPGHSIRREEIPQFLLPTQGAAPPAGDAAPAPQFASDPSGQYTFKGELATREPRLSRWEPAPLDLLDGADPVDLRRLERETAENIAILEEALESFKIGAKVVAIERGPAITRYEVEPEKGVRVARIAALADDLARVLEAVDVRIEAPVPGTSVVGIEVPNRTRALVPLKDILGSDEMQSRKSLLAFAIGKDIAGRVVAGDLARMPHMLVAGSTNSGKSVCLNALILSIILRASPEQVKFLLIDPKRVELSLYDDIPHLIAPVVHDARESAGLLRHAIVEMEQRYRTLAASGVRNITEYLELREERDDLEPMPYIVIVIDELADLMMQAAAEFEHSICRIAQLARAVGLHLVVATQRPSVDVVTGVIKANIPSRIAFAVASQTDSRVILDQVGADRLIGAGDMLYSPIDASKPRRIQGAYVSVKEINRVVEYTKQRGEPEYQLEPLPVDTMKAPPPIQLPMGVDDEGVDDDLFRQIASFVVTQRRISTSMLQRKFRIGYNRAARLIEILEEKGIVGPPDGSKPRRVMSGPGYELDGLEEADYEEVEAV
jgi:S-DNA-T family DNA segregation ATPase FtsK/SpoIIIE